jgi:hypothetical protein
VYSLFGPWQYRKMKTTATDNGYNVYRFDDERDETKQTLLGTFPTLDEAFRYAERNGGHQVQRGLDGEVTNLQTPETPTETVTYYAVAGQDYATCETLRWAWTSVEPYVLAKGSDAATVLAIAMARVGHVDVRVHAHV